MANSRVTIASAIQQALSGIQNRPGENRATAKTQTDASNPRQQMADPTSFLPAMDRSDVQNADAAADDLKKVAGNREQKDADERAEDEVEVKRKSTKSPTDFYGDFQKFSNENLGGRDIYDLFTTDGSDADRDAWRAITSDATMRQYYDRALREAGGFDQWYDQMTGRTIDDVMGDTGLQNEYLGYDPDAVRAIYTGAANEGFGPSVGGTGANTEAIYSLLASDPEMAAELMTYNYGVNALLGDEGIADSGLTLDEVNNMFQLDGMQFGYGDEFATDRTNTPKATSVEEIDPEVFMRSIEEGWASVPGYGIGFSGLPDLVAARYGGAGYQKRPGVEDLYAEASESKEA